MNKVQREELSCPPIKNESTLTISLLNVVMSAVAQNVSEIHIGSCRVRPLLVN